jgi:hypothetical protein
MSGWQKTWVAAQELRLLYRRGDRARAEQHFYAWLVHCADAGVPELQRLPAPSTPGVTSC